MKCDLCVRDDAADNGWLCISCREAIARLLVITEAQAAASSKRISATNAAVQSEEVESGRSAIS